jgi:ATP-dependent helicase HrpA
MTLVFYYPAVNHGPKQKSTPAADRPGEKDRERDARKPKRRRKPPPKNRIPEVTYDPALPISSRAREIAETIRREQVVVIAGETGSGKTTQIPKICLEAGRGRRKKIALTQPRRIAAVSVAERIAEELGEEPGDSVGYKIRFSERAAPKGPIKVMTDGMLLMEAQADPMLRGYDTVIVDEAHERSLNIDFILGILRQLMTRREDLKVIITSATIDTRKFASSFDDAPVIAVSGRMFPVEVRYRGEDDFNETVTTYAERAAEAARSLMQEGRHGDMLIFMPTEQDIRETCELLRPSGDRNSGLSAGLHPERIEVLPLFARLSSADQHRVFGRVKGRKIIVSTNIAETSLTIPGIRYVVDSGVARISRYSPAGRTTSLPVVPISRASADQRAGRCGRVEDGICVRLYSEEDYSRRPLYTPPEILRSNLAEVILRMLSLQLGDPGNFPFVDPPPGRSISDGIAILKEVGAVRTKGKDRQTLTSLGRKMAKLPLDPRLSRILLEASHRRCLEQAVIVAAALSIQDPRERPAEKEKEADAHHKAFSHGDSDFNALLAIWRAFRAAGRPGSSAARRFCRNNYISYRRMREWRDIYIQLRDELADDGLEDELPEDTGIGDPAYDRLHISLLSGFLSNVAVRRRGTEYAAARDRTVHLFPGSGLFDSPPSWIMAAEMVETSRLYARGVAAIQPAWIEKVGRHVCTYTHTNPRWDDIRKTVVATERVSLYGLVIEEGRTVRLDSIDRKTAAHTFIRDVLVGPAAEAFEENRTDEEPEVRVGEKTLRALPAVIRENRRLIDTMKSLEAKLRRRDILVRTDDLARFYGERTGTRAYDLISLKKFVEETGADAVRMTAEDITNYLPTGDDLSGYPETITLAGEDVTCRYTFDPDDPADGVTLNVPVSAAARISPEALDWIVPGLYREKIEALVRGLPKRYRRRLTPVNSVVDTITTEMRKGKAPMPEALSEFVSHRFRIDVPPKEWPMDAIPPHLQFRIALTSPEGVELSCGRGSGGLTGETESGWVEAEAAKHERHGVRSWEFDPIPEEIMLRPPPGTAAPPAVKFPALTPDDTGESVSLRLFDDPVQAGREHRRGVAALYRFRFAPLMQEILRAVPAPPDLKRGALFFDGAAELIRDFTIRTVEDVCASDIRSREEFEEGGALAAGELAPQAHRTMDLLGRVLTAFLEVRATVAAVESSGRPSADRFSAELSREAERLLPKRFLTRYSTDVLRRLPRYLEALSLRGRKWILDPAADTERASQITRYTSAYERLRARIDNGRDTTGGPPPGSRVRDAVEEFRWAVEEFKVSVFAQELGTAMKVSEKRLDRRIDEIEAMR